MAAPEGRRRLQMRKRNKSLQLRGANRKFVFGDYRHTQTSTQSAIGLSQTDTNLLNINQYAKLRNRPSDCRYVIMNLFKYVMRFFCCRLHCRCICVSPVCSVISWSFIFTFSTYLLVTTRTTHSTGYLYVSCSRRFTRITRG